MKFGVVIFPGSNCDKDIIFAIQNTIGQQVVELWHKDQNLQNCDVIFFPVAFLMEIICDQELLQNFLQL